MLQKYFFKSFKKSQYIKAVFRFNTIIDVFCISNAAGTLTDLNLSFCGLEFLKNSFFTKVIGIECLILDGNRLRELPIFTSSIYLSFSTVTEIIKRKFVILDLSKCVIFLSIKNPSK